MVVVVSKAVLLKKATSQETKAKGCVKVAKKGHRMLVMGVLIVHQIGMTKV